MIQPERKIEIGKYSFDISNISIKRKRIAVKMWNILFNIKINKDGEAETDLRGNVVFVDKPKKRSEKQASRGILKIGLYLLRQDFIVLNRRYKFTDAVKEFCRRYFLTVWYLESLTPDEMDIFVEWVYEFITGQKKKVTDLLIPMVDALETLTKTMTEEEMSHLGQYLQNSFLEQVTEFQSLNLGQKKA